MRTPIPTWQLQPAILEDDEFKHTIGLAIDTYFKTNEGSTTSTLEEWDAFKAVIRGKCLSAVAGERRALLHDIEKAEHNQRELERKCPKTPDLRASLTSAREKTIIANGRLCCHDNRAFLT
ncbi:hypothetical protein NDU88_002080 [Pleurodeles waltl]|uniref:Uncharacterized protein n=1 Tax=Pleurodeles waltl TaxID=8319 RepID=A0AAV7S9V7_PLEWA|nr:hypothetical protein NDU88_002080 [Pleurodeles waltl]